MPTMKLSKFAMGPKVAIEPPELQPPTTYAFHGRLLMVDQTVGSSGWSLMYFPSEGDMHPIEIERGMIRSEDGLSGHEAVLRQASRLFVQFRRLIVRLYPSQVVHEIPPVGGRMARPESSLVAATALRSAAIAEEVPVAMVGAQAAKKRWTGSAKADKQAVKRALAAYWPDLAERSPWNTDVTDAIALGLTWAEHAIV